MIIKKVGVFSLAKILGVLYAILGLIFGFFFSLFSLALGSLLQQSGEMSGLFSAIFGVGAIIMLPIIYGVMGFVFGALTAWLYNVIAGFAGGIEVEFEAEPAAMPQ